MHEKRFLFLTTLLYLSYALLTTACLSKAKDNANQKSTGNPKPVTTAKPIIAAPTATKSEDAFAKYAKFANSGFFIEVEEDMSNKVTVRQFKSMPTIYNQMIQKKGGHEIQNDGPSDTTMEEIKEPGSPPVESLVDDSKGAAWTQADEQVRSDWQGSCDAATWKKCNSVKKIQMMNVFNKTVDRDTVWVHLDLDCLLEPIVCLRNGWTCNRCHILCMSKCNHEILLGWDNLVSYDGACKYVR